MKNQIFTLLIASSAFVLIATGCKKNKNDDPTPPAKTKTELISTGTWKFSTATVNGINVSGALQSCQKDNTLTFQANGNGTIDEGATKCNGGDPQSSPYTWNFANDETILHVSTVLFAGGSNDFNVVEISDTKLTGSQTINAQTVVVTFIH